ncbi:hypothetical protein GCM10020258_54340 [Sphingomonas yabuuchiae]
MLITGLYGGADWGITDAWLTTDRPVVLIATVEKADALMRYLGPILIARIKLLIIDEAHQVVPDADESTRVSFAEHSNRAIRLETLVSRIVARQPEVVRIALTAVAGGPHSPLRAGSKAAGMLRPLASAIAAPARLSGCWRPQRTHQVVSCSTS